MANNTGVGLTELAGLRKRLSAKFQELQGNGYILHCSKEEANLLLSGEITVNQFKDRIRQRRGRSAKKNGTANHEQLAAKAKLRTPPDGLSQLEGYAKFTATAHRSVLREMAIELLQAPVNGSTKLHERTQALSWALSISEELVK